jgi:hypothetical protein
MNVMTSVLNMSEAVKMPSAPAIRSAGTTAFMDANAHEYTAPRPMPVTTMPSM